MRQLCRFDVLCLLVLMLMSITPVRGNDASCAGLANPIVFVASSSGESAPGAMDGIIFIIVVEPGIPPYTVLLNGLPHLEADGNEIIVDQLAAGEYTVQLIDIEGNTSDIVTVLVPADYPDPRVTNLKLEPIIYETGPSYPPGTHAWLSFDVMPGDELHFLNLGVTIPVNSVYWVIRNLPIPPVNDIQRMAYRINMEMFEPEFPLMVCEYTVGPEWYSAPDFLPVYTAELIPMPVIYDVGFGSDDLALSIGPVIPPILVPPFPFPGIPGLLFRGCDVDNVDLDNSTFYPPHISIPNDRNACGPAAAANSLHWLVRQHPELSHDTTSLRTKLDSLKRFMSMQKDDPNGVRFDSMVVGKLTLIDLLKLPIRVKYKTKHASGNTGVPLASLDSRYGHVADNQGSLGVYPDFEWYKKELDDGEDVEVHVGWYDPPDNNGVRMRNGGHWLVATGYFEAEETRGVFLKDDTNQESTNPDDLRHEYFEWDTLPGDIPYLRSLTDEDGRIGIVESLVSESYDPDITFVDLSQYDWTYKPITYLSGDITNYEFHAWMMFTHPSVPAYQFFNLRGTNPDNGYSEWLVRNFPIVPNATPRPIHYRMDMLGISNPSGPPDQVVAEIILGSFITDPDFIAQGTFLLEAEPCDHYVPGGLRQFPHAPIPSIPVETTMPEEPDDIFHLSRECTVPNIDLDSLAHPDPTSGDISACAPAAAANSLRWLMEVHPEIPIVDSLRGILDTLKAMMKKDSTGTADEDMVKGKLEYIDKHQLPIRVKYQVHTPYPSFKPIIPSPDSTYGHAAENKTGPSGFPDFTWVCNELQAGEDVELNFSYWCPDSTGMLVLTNGHSVVVTGYVVIGDMTWLMWKHDTRQDTVGGTVEEYGRWCVDSVGYPFLKEMSGSATGCIAYIGYAISESYDPDIHFEDVSAYNWMYKPIVYLDGGIQSDPHQAWITFTLPVHADARFLNARLCNPATGQEYWVLRNVPHVDRTSPMPVRIKIDLRPLVTGDTVPARLILKYHIGDYQGTAQFPVHAYAELDAWPIEYLVPDGGRIGPHPFIPPLPPLPVNPIPPYDIERLVRGCEVPNIDLDSLMYPYDTLNPTTTDYQACGPAASANSLQWLDDQHDEIDIPIEIRPMLDTLKRMMKLDPAEGGVHWEDIVKGKLEFIDQYQLPIRVKYQAHASAPAHIPSPNPLYGHKAANQSPPNPDMPGKYLHPTFDWLCQELMEEENVEMLIGYYCDTLIHIIDSIVVQTLPDGTEQIDTFYRLYITFDTLEDGTIVADTSLLHPKLQRKSGHVINITGKVKFGPLKWITYKHDTDQSGPGGTSPDDDEDSAFTDFSEWREAENGYAIIAQENYYELDGDHCTAYVEAVISESYDPDIIFCPTKVCIPDDDGDGSLRRALFCAQDGDTITIGPELANDTIRLTSGPLILDKNFSIYRTDQNPSWEFSIEGQSVSRVFEVLPGKTVTIDGLNIICGEAEDASCILNEGTLILRNMQFFQHDGIPGSASQIINTGTVRIEGTTNLRID